MTIFTDAQLLEIEPGKVYLNWELTQTSPVDVYHYTAIDQLQKHLGTTSSSYFEPCDSYHTPISRYIIRTADDVLHLGPRRISAEGTPNLRDFGGYRGADNRQVQWGQFYRSGKLSRLTARDHALIDDLGIRTIFDFRREEEQQQHPTPGFELSFAKILSLPIGEGSARSFVELVQDVNLTSQDITAGMKSIYRDLALEHSNQYREVFQHLLTNDTPLLIHCTAGKDRTGVGAALILLALGVSREDVLQDYVLTGQYYPTPQETADIQDTYSHAPDMLGNLDILLSSKPEFLQTLFDVIDQEFSDLESYLETQLGLDNHSLAELRDRWLMS